MKKTEKIIAATLIIALGVVLAVLQGQLISILMTAFGLGCIVFGCLDLYNRNTLPGIVKIIIGVTAIFFGWVLVGAVLYLLAAALIIIGVLLLYERIKCGEKQCSLLRKIIYYAQPILLLGVGLLLFFNQSEAVSWIFIFSGIFTVFEGVLLLTNALLDD